MSSSLLSISWFGSSGGGLPRRPGLKSLGRFFIAFPQRPTSLYFEHAAQYPANFQSRHHDPEPAVFLHLPLQLLENVAAWPSAAGLAGHAFLDPHQRSGSPRHAGVVQAAGAAALADRQLSQVAHSRRKISPVTASRFCDLRLGPRIKRQWYDNRLSPRLGKHS